MKLKPELMPGKSNRFPVEDKTVGDILKDQLEVVKRIKEQRRLFDIQFEIELYKWFTETDCEHFHVITKIEFNGNEGVMWQEFQCSDSREPNNFGMRDTIRSTTRYEFILCLEGMTIDGYYKRHGYGKYRRV